MSFLKSIGMRIFLAKYNALVKEIYQEQCYCRIKANKQKENG